MKFVAKIFVGFFAYPFVVSNLMAQSTDQNVNYYKQCFLHEALKRADVERIDQKFSSAVKSNDYKAISRIIRYPLKVRQGYKEKIVKDEAEFLSIAKDIFTDEWKATFSGGDSLECDDRSLFYKDWSAVIEPASYKSSELLQLTLIRLPEGGGRGIFSSDSTNVLKCETEKHLISVEQYAKESFSYRSWNKPSDENAKPSLELKNGTRNYSGEGTGACIGSTYTFKNGKTSYILNHTPCAGKKDAPNYSLLVKQGDKSLGDWECKSQKL